ncbi:MAG: heme-copper oxidase subunit III [Candidatus Omnitrophica bacterium]|nr:heme-copper oxidase subunit III [Candidatus Omnitrophota bacterium]
MENSVYAEGNPYTVEERPDTGVYNAKMGIWLFLASEVMLFGALFSSYILLRVGSDSWPRESLIMNVPVGAANTVVLIASSMTMVMSWASLKLKNFKRFKMFQGLTVLLAFLFLALKFIEYSGHFSKHLFPQTGIFWALYYLMTGLHALHVTGGIIVNGYFWGPGSRMWFDEPERFTNRIEVAGLYWRCVDIVWIFLLPTLYLL